MDVLYLDWALSSDVYKMNSLIYKATNWSSEIIHEAVILSLGIRKRRSDLHVFGFVS
jgi:hypothetical protein